nr:hypothetical protein [Tanacetum cinerariifolium]
MMKLKPYHHGFHSVTSSLGTVTGGWCLFGDFNDVRTVKDRLNSEFNTRDADNFNDFIRKNELVEIPLGGRRFTRISDGRLKFSKLDRFFVTDHFYGKWRNLVAVSLDRKLSNHCPILLKDIDMDFGPKPFRAYDVWLEENDIDNVFISAWHNPVRNYKADCVIRDKFKNAKQGLKEWSKLKLDGNNHAIEKCKREAMKWEMEAENRVLASSNGFMEDSGSLEAPFTEKEVWEAVCGCGSDKNGESKGCNASFVTLILKVDNPLGLGDYRPISLIGSYYKVISKLLSERIKKGDGMVEMGLQLGGVWMGNWAGEIWSWNWDWACHVRGRTRGEALELQNLVENVSLNRNRKDSWRCSLDGNGEFSVKSLSKWVEDMSISGVTGSSQTLWPKIIPRKCGECRSLYGPMRKCSKSLGVDFCLVGYVDRFTIGEILKHRGGSVVNSETKDLWQAVLWVTGYYIWKNRNAKVFKNKCNSVLRVFLEVQLRSFEWISRRSKKRNFNWENG